MRPEDGPAHGFAMRVLRRKLSPTHSQWAALNHTALITKVRTLNRLECGELILSLLESLWTDMVLLALLPREIPYHLRIKGFQATMCNEKAAKTSGSAIFTAVVFACCCSTIKRALRVASICFFETWRGPRHWPCGLMVFTPPGLCPCGCGGSGRGRRGRNACRSGPITRRARRTNPDAHTCASL